MADPLMRKPEPEAMDLGEEAAAYAAADFAEVNEAFVARLLELAHGEESVTALDLGTGPGDIPVRIIRHRPKWMITAADVSMAMLTFAREHINRSGAAHAIVPIQTDAKSLPFCDHAFDIVFSNSILHHVTDTAALWSEIRRVAKDGAVIFFRDLARPASESEAHEIVAKYAGAESQLLQEEYYRSLLSAYTVEEVRAQLDRAGLHRLDVKKVTDRHLDIF